MTSLRQRRAAAGLHHETVRYRMRAKGMSLEEALTWRRPPTRKKQPTNREISSDSVSHQLADCPLRTERSRLLLAWPRFSDLID